MKKVLLFSLTTVILFSCSNKKEKDIQIVKNGKSEYTITISKQASKEELRAAEFLSEHIQKISDCKIPVKTTDTLLLPHINIKKKEGVHQKDAFAISFENENIFIEGNTGRACIYAVSELLERYFDVRYYSPENVIIPKSKNLSIPKKTIADSSVNTYRNVHGEFVQHQDYKDFHRLHSINDMFADNYYVHTFHKIIPWKKYFKSNPEYFAYMNGKRIIDQVCLSNPDVLQLTIEKLKEEMTKQPDKIVWSVSQNDNFSYCQCKSCKKIIEEEESAAGPIIHFVNKIAEEFPDKIISTLAYQYSRKAPKKIKPNKNVQVMLCTIELNRSQSIATDKRSISFLKDMEDWGKICNHIYLWDYTVDFAHMYCPFPNLHVLQPNIQLFAKNNVKEHFQQTNTGIGHEFSELKSYLLAKLLWNPNADVKAIITEFINGYYGDAGQHIRKYIYHLQDEIIKTEEWLDIYGPPTNYSKTFLSQKNIKAYNEYFDDAEEAVKNQPEYLLHVKKARMSLQYAMMEIGKSDMFGERGWYKEVEGKFIPEQNMLSMLEEFIQTARKAGCKHINESGLTAEAYYTSSKRFIDVKVDDNLAFRKKITASPPPAEKYGDGNLKYLTNGVCGANDFKVHWLGWQAKDFELLLDLEEVKTISHIEISSLYDPKSWILHPKSVHCSVSEDGKTFTNIGKQTVEGNQQDEEVNRTFRFEPKNKKARYVKFKVKGTQKLYDWHPSAGGGSWVFIDEVVIK